MLIIDKGRIYFGQPHKMGKISGLGRMTLICLDAKTGKQLWSKKVRDFTYTTSFNVYAVKDKLIVHDNGSKNANQNLKKSKPKPLMIILDAATGKEIKKYDISSINSHHHPRCYRNKATEKYLLLGKEGVEYINFETGEVTVNRWVRGSCLFGIMPANGLLYSTPAACACNQMNRLDGFKALAPVSLKDKIKKNNLFIKGPAYGAKGKDLPADAWPQYRHDMLRSGMADLSPEQKKGWKIKLNGRLTAPVSDGKKIYFGCGKEVLAMGCNDGSVLWRAHHTIDSPPTLFKGLLIFGTRDGWVICLQSSDGELVWKFRAAPYDRLILDDSRLESVWPVHGSLLLFKGIIYVSAGRSSFLDKGIHLYALNPKTGAVIKSSTLFTEQTLQVDYYEGVNNDLLASDGESIFMKHMKIDTKNLKITRQGWWQFTGPDGTLKKYKKPWIKLPVEQKRTSVLSSPSGLLDDELFGRVHVSLDGGEFCNRLSFDDKYAYGIRHSTGPGHFQFHTPGKDSFPVLCFDRKMKKTGSKKKKPKADHRILWENDLKVRPSALLATKKLLFIGGGPDKVYPDDPHKSFEWRAGGLLYILDRSDGKTVSKQNLSAPPVHEGLIAVQAGVFGCLKDNTVVKLTFSDK